VFLLAIRIWKYIFLVINSRRIRWVGHVARIEEKSELRRGFVGKTLGKPRRRLENNIKLDIQEVGCGVMSQDRVS